VDPSLFVRIRILPSFFEATELNELGLEAKKILKKIFFKSFKRNRRLKNSGVVRVRPRKTYFPPRKIAQVLVEWISGHFQG
jgi:hypothetical protein